jgi:hypothetical protein
MQQGQPERRERLLQRRRPMHRQRLMSIDLEELDINALGPSPLPPLPPRETTNNLQANGCTDGSLQDKACPQLYLNATCRFQALERVNPRGPEHSLIPTSNTQVLLLQLPPLQQNAPLRARCRRRQRLLPERRRRHTIHPGQRRHRPPPRHTAATRHNRNVHSLQRILCHHHQQRHHELLSPHFQPHPLRRALQHEPRSHRRRSWRRPGRIAPRVHSNHLRPAAQAAQAA